VIRDGRWREKPGELEPAVAVRRAHHGNLDALIAQSSDTSGPFSFDCGSPFELEAELAKELNRRRKVIDDDSYVIHPFKRHLSNLQSVVYSDNGRARSSPTRNETRIPCRGVLNDFVNDDARLSVFAAFAGALRRSGVLILDVREWEATREQD
jgi:hypothetical protein